MIAATTTRGGLAKAGGTFASSLLTEGCSKEEFTVMMAVNEIKDTDLVFDRLYKTAKQVAEKVLAEVLKVTYSQKFIQSQLGHMPVRTFCKTRMRWHEDRIQKIFGQFEKYLNADLMGLETVNPTFAYQVITRLCSNAFDWLGDAAKDYIKYLKNYSKKVCLKYGLTQEELPAELTSLENIVDFIYNNLEAEFKFGAESKIESIREILKNALDNNISSEASSPSFLSDFAACKLIAMQKHLKAQYSKLEMHSPYLWISDTLNKDSRKGVTGLPGEGQIYFPLKDGEGGKNISPNDLLSTAKTFPSEYEIMPPLLILNGPVGCGKTTLCHYLVQSWLSNSDTLQKFDLVIFIECFKAESLLLKPYLKEKLLDACSCDVSNMFTFLKDLEVLWVLDGFHEVQDDSFSIIGEVLELFGNHRILLTTRAQDAAVMKVVLASYVNYHVIHLSTLDEKEQIKIASLVIRDQLRLEKEVNKKVKQFKEDHYEGARNIVEHLKLPASVALYTAFWLEKGCVSIKTAGQLHEQMHKFAVEKATDRDGFKNFGQLCDLTSEFSYRLGQAAWLMLKKGKHVLNKEKVQKLQDYLTEKGLDACHVMSALFTCNLDHTVTPERKQFSFISRLQQAHFAAVFVANRAHTDGKYMSELQKQGLDWKHFPEVLMCTVGQLCARNSNLQQIQRVLSMITERNCHPESFPYWWNVCHESHEHPTVAHFVAQVLPRPHWVLNHINCVAGLKLLSLTKVKLASIKIDIHNQVDPYKIPELLQVMQRLPEALKDRHRNPVEVELHFWQHDEFGCGKPSDQFIETLSPWGILVNLTGELGGIRNAVTFRHIRTIRVRVSSRGALVALNDITKHLLNLARVVRLTVGLPETCDPSTLPQLSFPNLELNFNRMDENNKLWVVAVIRRLGGRAGVWRVSIKSFNLPYTEMLQLMKELSSSIIDKLSLGLAENLSDGQMKKLQQAASFVVNLL